MELAGPRRPCPMGFKRETLVFEERNRDAPPRVVHSEEAVMFLAFRSTFSALVLSLTVIGTAQAYTVLLTDDYNGGDYGSIWGKCQDGTEFEVRWLTEGDDVTYSLGSTTGYDDPEDLMRDFCASHGG